MEIYRVFFWCYALQLAISFMSYYSTIKEPNEISRHRLQEHALKFVIPVRQQLLLIKIKMKQVYNVAV